MNDSILKSVLEKSIMLELAECKNTPEHKFSLKHRLAMKRIFVKYERNVRKLQEAKRSDPPVISKHRPRLNFRTRLLIATIIIILMAFFAGWAEVDAFDSEKFHGTVYNSNTWLTAVDIENSPKYIEYRYDCPYVPDGFIPMKSDISARTVYTHYKNNLTNQTITVFQCVKSHYTLHINTKHHILEEIPLKGSTALYVDMGDENYNKTLLVWDKGDYIIEIQADLNKEDTVKMFNNYKF